MPTQPSPSPPTPGVPQRRLGRSGLTLPTLSLGLWQNFGEADPVATQREIVLHAVDRGVTHLDLANNYGPPGGAAEESFGRLLARDLRPVRDELVVTTKAGYRMGPGPYGEGGSRKYLLASLDASLRRLGVDHVDIFYSHRFDPTTPLTETVGALATAVRSGRARHVGISSYSARRTREALSVAADLGIDLAVTQVSYSMLNRWIEEPDADAGSVLDVAGEAGLGVVAFSPLAQGMLTDKYLHGTPDDSRAARGGPLRPEYLSPANLERVRHLDGLARAQGRTLAATALVWALRNPRVTTVLVGASSVRQLDANLAALDAPPLSDEELRAVDAIPVDTGINLWASRSSDL
ncbi:aldo/keto reductase [Cellulosimicrobium marinum]|uniref:aldo/keto reductase n=1 Tax=Cellulosimicrobium marinum TaxID=1638992 RepID=UPI001E51B40D|nr:aldo/keto reductase [Cellulosimicrobium marinum]MCB7137759.1 aldo/keto reductase [Cellulosimicrobium marinum]